MSKTAPMEARKAKPHKRMKEPSVTRPLE